MENTPQIIALPIDTETIRYLQLIRGGHEPHTRLLAMAQALSLSPPWLKTQRAVLVARASPSPVLGFIGFFNAVEKNRLEALRWQIENILPRIRYLSYHKAEDACQRLAIQLLKRFGREELERFQFTAIPNGGFIVLGMLACILGLRQSQLDPPFRADRPLVVVDDCALSGVRFAQFLERSQYAQVVFVHLYSSPKLRKAIEAREPRVVACLGALDLCDHAPEIFGVEYPAWKNRWLARLGNQGYWIGLPNLVCFPWNEPDTSIWNPINEQEECGWQFLPPENCLKTRLNAGAAALRVQLQPEGKGPLKPSSKVLFAEFEGQIIVGNLETGLTFGLSDVAADMWRAIVEYGNPKDIGTALLKTYDVNEGNLRADLEVFVKDLLDRNLLVRNDEPKPNHRKKALF